MKTIVPAFALLLLAVLLGSGCATTGDFAVTVIPIEADGQILWTSGVHLSPEELSAVLQRDGVPQQRAILLSVRPGAPQSAVASTVDHLAAAGYRDVRVSK